MNQYDEESGAFDFLDYFLPAGYIAVEPEAVFVPPAPLRPPISLTPFAPPVLRPAPKLPMAERMKEAAINRGEKLGWIRKLHCDLVSYPEIEKTRSVLRRCRFVNVPRLRKEPAREMGFDDAVRYVNMRAGTYATMR